MIQQTPIIMMLSDILHLHLLVGCSVDVCFPIVLIAFILWLTLFIIIIILYIRMDLAV